MNTNIFFKGFNVLLLSIAIIYLVRIQSSLSEIEEKLATFHFYTYKDRQAINENKDPKIQDSLWNEQTVLQIYGDVDARIEKNNDY